jgi:mannan endo-1,4-beta-mannosidase
MARIVRECLAEATDGRPFLDTEHGPIHTFKDRKVSLPEPFDDEYFRHVQWAHLAAGGAGGGMRWPNRHPHRLTPGMHTAQRALSAFLPLIDWPRFRRRSIDVRVADAPADLAAVSCGDAGQAVIWLVRRDSLGADGRLRRDVEPIRPHLAVPGLAPGRYAVTAFDTGIGWACGSITVEGHGGDLAFETPPFDTDLAIAICADR